MSQFYYNNEPLGEIKRLEYQNPVTIRDGWYTDDEWAEIEKTLPKKIVEENKNPWSTVYKKTFNNSEKKTSTVVRRTEKRGGGREGGREEVEDGWLVQKGKGGKEGGKEGGINKEGMVVTEVVTEVVGDKKKSQMCRRILERKRCSGRCDFAHSTKELQPMGCRFGNRCRIISKCGFIHPTENKTQYIMRLGLEEFNK
jgi:hypothetical protein